MYFNVEYILISLFVVSFANAKQLDFCQSFVDNNNEIDFGYQHLIAGYYFFIDSNYWRLEYSEKTFRLLNTSRKLKDMNKSYKFAFSVKVCENSTTDCQKNHWRTGLFNREDDSENWSESMPDSRTPRRITLIELESNSASGELTVKNGSRSASPELSTDITPMIAFHLMIDPIACLLQQRSNGSEDSLTYYRTYRCIRFNKEFVTDGIFVRTVMIFNEDNKVLENLKKVMDFNKVPYGPDHTILNSLEDKHKLIAIFDTGDHYVFFSKEDKRLTYCFSSGPLFNLGCSESGLKVLIDCSNTKNNETTNEPSDEPITSGNVTDVPIIPEFTEVTNNGDITEFPDITEEPMTTNQTIIEEPKSGSFPYFWILIVFVLFIVIIIVLFVVFKFILWEQKGHNDQQKDNNKNPDPNEGPVSPVTPKGSPNDKKLANKRKI